jgi:hypothetical protein
MAAHKLTEEEWRASLARRFWAKVGMQPKDRCWLWRGRRAKRYGYGELHSRRGRPPLKAHRVSYELHNGLIAPGLVVLHSCDNTACVNPAHLSLGTQLDNIADTVAKGRHNPRGLRFPKGSLQNVK